MFTASCTDNKQDLLSASMSQVGLLYYSSKAYRDLSAKPIHLDTCTLPAVCGHHGGGISDACHGQWVRRSRYIAVRKTLVILRPAARGLALYTSTFINRPSHSRTGVQYNAL